MLGAMLRVLVADGYALVRDGVKRIVDEQVPEAAYGDATTCQEVVRLAREHEWDLAVVDLMLGGRRGLDVLKEIKQVKPALPILVLSVYSEEQYARRAFQAGAAAYVTKDSPRCELVDAIQRVIQGGRYASSTITEQMLAGLSRPGDGPRHAALSDRELEVMCLISAGHTVSEISHLLSLADSTVSTYRARILKKMGLKSNAALMHYAIQAGLAV